FVAMQDIPAGTLIRFTDKRWTGSSFATNENVMDWTAPLGGVLAGTEISINNTTANIGTASGPANSFATSGENLFAFQGETVTPNVNFIAGFIYNNVAGGWSAGTANENSVLPASLGASSTVVISLVTGELRAYYNCSVASGTLGELQAA